MLYPGSTLCHLLLSVVATDAERVVELGGKYERLQPESLAPTPHTRWVPPERCVVFRVEHRLAGGDERPQRLTLGKLVTLLVDREVEVAGELGNLVEAVLQAHGEGPLVGRRGQE